MMYGWGGYGGMGIFMIIFWLIGLAVLGFAVYGIIQWANKGGPRSGSSPVGNALEILKERYARGEITKEEFDRVKEDLKA
ncbi:MAG: SHOCT domain-containing protein [Bacillota bacterium]